MTINEDTLLAVHDIIRNAEALLENLRATKADKKILALAEETLSQARSLYDDMRN